MGRTHIMQKVTLGLAVLLASCNLFVGDNPTDTQEDVLSLQAALPALTAAQALGVPTDPIVSAVAGFATQAITPLNDPGLPLTPAAMEAIAYEMDDATGNSDPNTWYYPARDLNFNPADETYYIQDLFATGNLAFVKLDRSNPARYMITLTILPGLSTHVEKVEKL